jgi:biopolymer transport protein ExbB
MLPNTILSVLPEEFITGGIVLWLIIILGLVCYSVIFESFLCCVKSKNLTWVKSWLQPLHVLVSAMPLLGLLGTIIGLLDTFSALSANSGLTISDAIGKALLTTQAGLLVAIPAMVMLWKLTRMVEAQEREYAS